MANKKYNSSWNSNNNRAAYNRKFKEWMKRDWVAWLKKTLTFPFEVERVEDDDDAYFQKGAIKEPFRLGHHMMAIGLDEEDATYGIMIRVHEKNEDGLVPLAEVEAVPKKNPNFWPVREYGVWFANRG